MYKASQKSNGWKDYYTCSIDTLPTDIKSTFKSFDYIHYFLLYVDEDDPFMIETLPCDSNRAECSDPTFSRMSDYTYDDFNDRFGLFDSDVVEVDRSDEIAYDVFDAYD